MQLLQFISGNIMLIICKTYELYCTEHIHT